MRMLSVMAKAKRMGYLLDGEKQMESKTLAKLYGETEAETDLLIAELFNHGVPSKTDDGIIFNRRLVRDSRISDVRSLAGRMGGRPKKQTESKPKAKSKQGVKANTKAPSVSASVSASVSSSELEKEFNQFWTAYPRHDGKTDALKAFTALRNKGIPITDIAKGFNGYIEYLKDKRLKENFAQSPKHAATFLRNDCWREYINYKSTPVL